MFIDLRNPPSALSRDSAELFLGRADSCRSLKGVQLQTSPEGAGNQDFRFHYSPHSSETDGLLWKLCPFKDREGIMNSAGQR